MKKDVAIFCAWVCISSCIGVLYLIARCTRRKNSLFYKLFFSNNGFFQSIVSCHLALTFSFILKAISRIFSSAFYCSIVRLFNLRGTKKSHLEDSLSTETRIRTVQFFWRKNRSVSQPFLDESWNSFISLQLRSDCWIVFLNEETWKSQYFQAL